MRLVNKSHMILPTKNKIPPKHFENIASALIIQAHDEAGAAGFDLSKSVEVRVTISQAHLDRDTPAFTDEEGEIQRQQQQEYEKGQAAAFTDVTNGRISAEAGFKAFETEVADSFFQKGYRNKMEVLYEQSQE